MISQSRAVLAVALALAATPAAAELQGLDVVSRAPLADGRAYGTAGAYEKLVLKARFSVDPRAPRNRIAVDVGALPRARGRVLFDADVVVLQPVDPARSAGGAILEPQNRGGPQLAPIAAAAAGRSYAGPDAELVGDGYLLRNGHTLVFAGWQVLPGSGPTADGRLALRGPVARVEGRVREPLFVETAGPKTTLGGPCPDDLAQPDAVLGLRVSPTAPLQAVPRAGWRFSRPQPQAGAAAQCDIVADGGFRARSLYEVTYTPAPETPASLGLLALRDLASALKGGAGPQALGPVRRTSRVVGYGNSQSARLLRRFVQDGFNADERGRRAFDGLFLSTAGAGGASVNHRLARPGMAGNSVGSFLYPVDVFPFADAGQDDPLLGLRGRGQLDRARRDGVAPRIMHVMTSTEYWARNASLLHTTVDGRSDLPLAPGTRIYLVSGTQHGGRGTLTLRRKGRTAEYQNFINIAPIEWTTRALLGALDRWVADGTEPPPSAYPRIADGTLVPLENLKFPTAADMTGPDYMPGIWRMDFGPAFERTGQIEHDPPRLGAPYRVLVPAVDADGNERAGVRQPHLTTPVAAWTGWNVELPPARELGILAALTGSTFPLPRTPAEAAARRDGRRPISERYRDRADYLAQVRADAERLARAGYVRMDDVPAIETEAGVFWDLVQAQPAP
jgi:hypothetical protein